MMLIEFAADDLKMSQWSDRLHRVVGVSEEASTHLATTIYRDILALPTSLLNVSDVMSYTERFNELALFLNWIAESHMEKASSLLSRARLTLSNYMCFVYLGDTCFTRLRKELPDGTAARLCCQYLTDNPIRAFRNAVAHGNWRVSDGVVHFWARKGADPNEPLIEFQVPDADREFWFFLAACTGKSAFAALARTPLSGVQ
jgi:hypothetical protein